MNINSSQSNSFFPEIQNPYTSSSQESEEISGISERLDKQNLFEILSEEIRVPNSAVIKSIITHYSKEFEAELTRQDDIGNSIIHLAVKSNNFETLELILEKYSHLVSPMLIIKNREGKTPVCLAMMGTEDMVGILTCFAKYAKEGFEAALMVTDNRDYLPIHRALYGGHLESIKLIWSASPEIQNKILNRHNKKGNTLIHDIVIVNNIEVLEFLVKINTKLVSRILTVKNNEGQTPICLALLDKDKIEILRCFAKYANEGFKAALLLTDKRNYLPIHQALDGNHLESAKLILETSQRTFYVLFNWSDRDKNTIIHKAISHDYYEVVDLLFRTAPELFSVALTRKNKNGETAVHLAQSLKMYKFLAENVPVDLKISLKIQNNRNQTILHCLAQGKLADTTKIFNYLYAFAPNQFLQASAMRDFEGLSPLDIIKKQRISNFREITVLFDLTLKNINKEISNTKALSHVLHISGDSRLTIKNSKSSLALSLEGWSTEQWFHMLAKDLAKISKNAMLPWKSELNCLENALKIASDSYRRREVEFNQILDGKPTFVVTGFIGHSVTLLIWGNQMIICNRGKASNKPIEVFHFDPNKFDLNDLNLIKDLLNQPLDVYEDQLFKKLPKKLKFFQTKNDKALEKIGNMLEDQEVGNCSLVSPITSIFAFNLLAEARGVDENGLLGDDKHTHIVDEDLTNATIRYAKWLALQEFAVLERSILSIESSTMETDHGLIQTGLRIANLSLPDELLEALDKLTEVYFNSTDNSTKIVVNTDLCYWRSRRKTFVALPSSLKAFQIISHTGDLGNSDEHK